MTERKNDFSDLLILLYKTFQKFNLYYKLILKICTKCNITEIVVRVYYANF